MKIEVGQTYESKTGEQWKIVHKLDLKNVSHPYLGVELWGRCAFFNETGANRSGGIQLIDKSEESKLKPFTLETFPADAWLRRKNATEYYRVLSLDTECIEISGMLGAAKFHTWSELFEDWEYSVDGCKTWHQCGVRE